MVLKRIGHCMKKNIERYYKFGGTDNRELINSCITNCIYTILQIEKINNPIMYLDCSLCFCLKRDDNSLLGYSYSCEREILITEYSERVIEHNNLDYYDYDYYSYEELWETHKHNLKENKPIVLLCDLYYLDYYKNINKQHRLHGIIAYDIDEINETLQIIDNGSQFYNGPITMEVFKRAWCSEYFDNMNLLENEIPSNKVWFEVVTDNWIEYNYQRIYQINLYKTIKYYYGSGEGKNILAGLVGLELLLQRFQLCYRNGMNMEVVLKELKDILFEVINRKKLNRLFLCSSYKEVPNVKLDSYISLLENDLVVWNGLYNLVLKGMVGFNERIFNKIENKYIVCLSNERSREKLLKEIFDNC